MINRVSKLFERLILNQLQPHLEDKATGLSGSNFGFRQSRSTIDAVKHVVKKTIKTAWEGTAKASKGVLLVNLDVQKAFNSSLWDKIVEALKEGIRAPKYLVSLIKDYLQGRDLEHKK
jgi:hypothetical protein